MNREGSQRNRGLLRVHSRGETGMVLTSSLSLYQSPGMLRFYGLLYLSTILDLFELL
jgi:hypothetical protein